MKSSISRKILMALSGFFLMFFLLQHLLINLLSVFSPDMFNEMSHFMGYNPLIQFLMQPILIAGIVFHFVMGFILEMKNNKARNVKYAQNNAAANSTWVSRNMIYSGLVILFFIFAHMAMMWVPEMDYKYIGEIGVEDPTRYYPELIEKFHSIAVVAIYTLAFVFLALHLLHGFQSAFQSVGFNHNKYTPVLKKLGVLYAIAVPALYCFVAWFHFLTQQSH